MAASTVRKRGLIGAAIASVVLLGATACQGFESRVEQWNDAPVEHKYDNPAEVYSMPDGFANVASKCDAHGNRIYSTRSTDKGGGKAVAVLPDPTCRR